MTPITIENFPFPVNKNNVSMGEFMNLLFSKYENVEDYNLAKMMQEVENDEEIEVLDFKKTLEKNIGK